MTDGIVSVYPGSRSMTGFLRIVGVLALLLVLAPSSPPAQAMEVAVADDLTMVFGYSDRDLALRQFKRMGGDTVRLAIEHQRDGDARRDVRAGATRTSLELYDSAVKAITDHGLKVQITLIWKRQSRPDLVAEWMGNVARHFGTRVTRYSVLNEPDLFLPSSCGPRRQRDFIERFPDEIVRGGNGVQRARVLTRGGSFKLSIACLKYHRGLHYRRIVRQVEHAIHAQNPRAQILAGESSAQEGLEWFIRGAQPQELQIDGWAHHPYQLRDLTPRIPSEKWGIGSLPLLQRTLKVPLYLTEFGYPHPKSKFAKAAFGRQLTPRETARALTIAWRLARKSGARQMLQYQWFVKPRWRKELWDTALLNSDNGALTLAYRALQKLILSWPEDD